ncbi:MAG TPA: FtsK/SpoIIIE domain-containing protein, partial [Dehalococcoidales bacterium]|nr:FtsK/SpoIIIE domain-containing protein [Dehalococcoidales bacterium]
QKLMAKSKLAVALGKGAGGEAGAADLARMPHLLIAGATGSGKTVCLNATICCLLMHNTPDELRFIMVDPKRVELTPFNSIPHLATPVIVNAEKAVEALRWLEVEMDQRYQLLAKAGARNIDGYNKDKKGKDRMPFLVLVVDELADLMMAGYDEVERILCRLAQLSRAVGIHLVVATQRPSVDVITGLIKANFPTRLSFAVTSQVDSRTILDAVGAEKLLGKGDMLYAPTEAAKPKRLQGCFVSDPETERLVYFWGSQKAEHLSQIDIEAAMANMPSIHEPPKDALLDQARKLVEDQDQISASFLQRKLQVGYPRAARLKELLDNERQAEEREGPPEQTADEPDEAGEKPGDDSGNKVT